MAKTITLAIAYSLLTMFWGASTVDKNYTDTSSQFYTDSLEYYKYNCKVEMRLREYQLTHIDTVSFVTK